MVGEVFFFFLFLFSQSAGLQMIFFFWEATAKNVVVINTLKKKLVTFLYWKGSDITIPCAWPGGLLPHAEQRRQIY